MAIAAYGTAAEQDMIAQSPTGTTSTIKPPTMTAGGAILQPPTQQQLAPTTTTSSSSTSTLAPAPAPAPTTSTSTAAPAPSLTASAGAPGTTAPSSSAANLAIAAPTATLVNGVYTVNGQQQALPSSSGQLPAGQDAASAPYTPGSGTTTGALDWGLPGSGMGTSADPTGAMQRAAGYIPWSPQTNGPVATDANSPLYLSGRLPLADGKFIDGRTVDQVTHPAAQVVPYGQQGAGTSMAGQPLTAAPAAPRIAPPSSATDVRPSIPAPAPQQLAPLPGATAQNAPGANGVSTTPLTGSETPQRVAPTQSDALQQLLAKLRGEASRQLDQPTIWDDELAGRIVDQQKRGINEDFAGAQEGLNAELANRGINWSSIAGSRNVDLATRRAQALGDVDTNIARERANALAAGRKSAFDNASGMAGQQFGMEQTLQNAERSERQYATDQNQQAWQNELQRTLAEHGMSMQDQEAWMQAVQQGLNYGSGTAGSSALTGAASINNATGSQYGQQASGSGEQLSQLLQLAMQFYGGGK